MNSGIITRKFLGLCVGIDAANLRLGGGVTHLEEILKAVKPEELGIQKMIVWGGKQTLDRLPNVDWLLKINPLALNKGLIPRIFWQCFSLSKAAKSNNCDVLFVPGGSFVGSFSPTVTMSQNLLPFEWAELRRSGLSLFIFKMLALRLTQTFTFQRSAGVIFLTRYARKVVEGVIGALKGRVFVIAHGVSDQFKFEPKKQYSLDEYTTRNPYEILYVSNVDVYKHQVNVVRALNILRGKGFPLRLTMVGPAAKGPLRLLQNELEKVKIASSSELDLKDRYLGQIPYSRLVEYYRNADLAIFASSCETFGIILIEKMLAGLPIACSNLSSMGEILQDGGLYFNPLDPESIASCVEEYLKSPDLREEKIQLSQKRAQEFSWEKCAQETFRFIAEVAYEARRHS